MKCNMDKDINTCPYVSEDKENCNHPDPQCAFSRPNVAPEKKKVFVRKEKWYEKYYKKFR